MGIKLNKHIVILFTILIKKLNVCHLYYLQYSNLMFYVIYAQTKMQTKGLPFDKVVKKLEALIIYLNEERNHLVENSMKQALEKSVNMILK